MQQRGSRHLLGARRDHVPAVAPGAAVDRLVRPRDDLARPCGCSCGCAARTRWGVCTECVGGSHGGPQDADRRDPATDAPLRQA